MDNPLYSSLQGLGTPSVTCHLQASARRVPPHLPRGRRAMPGTLRTLWPRVSGVLIPHPWADSILQPSRQLLLG